MQRFNVEENLNIIVRLLTAIGTWPKNSPSIWYKIRGFTTVSVVTLGIVLTAETALKFVDIQTASFSICLLLITINTMVKYVFIYIKRKDLFNLIEILNDPLLSLHEDHLYKFLKTKAKLTRFFQNGFLMSGVGTGLSILMRPIFNTTSNRPLPVPFFVDIEERGFSAYGLAWLYEFWAVMLTCVNICSFDGLIFFFIAMAGAELRILREKIIEAVDVASLDYENVQVKFIADKHVNGLLKKCVIQHITIERYVLSIQTTFSNAFLAQLTISLGAACFAGFMLVIVSLETEHYVPINSFEFWVCGLLFAAITCQLGLFCIPGNEIILQSEKIRDACYMSQWVNCGPSVRKTLFIIMERAKRPLILSAGNFISLSLDMLVSVLKSAFSYFTVLNRMYGDSMKMQ